VVESSLSSVQSSSLSSLILFLVASLASFSNDASLTEYSCYISLSLALMTQQHFKVSLQGRMRRLGPSWFVRTSLCIVKLAQFRRIHQGVPIEVQCNQRNCSNLTEMYIYILRRHCVSWKFRRCLEIPSYQRDMADDGAI
jgi:hypothetical protein